MSKKLNTAFNLLFVIILTGFGLFGLFQLGTNNPEWLEKRNNTPPQFAFSNAFDQQFSENPGYISSLADVKKRLFNKAITPKVIPGRDGWLFLGQEDPLINTIPQSLGIQQFTETELKHWKLLFTQRQEWCMEKNIDFYLVIAPNKATIYPENLPGRFKMLMNPSMTGQLIERLEKSSVPVLNLLPYLLFSKGENTLFHKNDTHWNDDGAFIAANAILGSLSQDFAVSNQLSAFFVKDTVKKSGDLARMMMAKDRYETIRLLEPKNGKKYAYQKQKAAEFPEYLNPEVTTSPEGRIPKAQLFHDSFGEMLKPFLSPHFKEIQYFRLWKGFEPYWIEREQPEIVLNLIVERIFMSQLTHNDPLLLQWYWGRRFDKLDRRQLAAGKRNSAEDTFAYLSKTTVSADDTDGRIWVFKLTLTSQADGKLGMDYDGQRLNYELNAGQNELYLQAIPGQRMTISLQDGLQATVEGIELGYF